MRLGPIVGATLVVRDLERARRAYVEQLGLLAGADEHLPRQRALDLGDAALADAPCLALRGAADAGPWLTLIEMPAAVPAQPFERRGWAALALAATDVGKLAEGLDPQDWRVLQRPGADAGLQIAGVDGEVLHLGPAPQWLAPCELPAARCPVDRVVAATLAVRDCGAALGFYEGLGLVDRWRQDARRARAGAAVALAQLRGPHAIRFEQQPSLPAAEPGLRTGVRLVSFARSDSTGRRLAAHDDPSARILSGPDGEAIELV